ncbi:NAD-dependent succinate-semialdehyde dehydrogenase, partial [Candidatus Woesearchaeota archaeon]|nr:NAD-dependent succinate-semialdehyde dehydrogenase [Candidatus Woesearchaeota archaeon]
MAKFQTINPATEEVIREYETMPKAQVLGIVQQCHDAFRVWKNYSMKERAAQISHLGTVLLKNKKKYAALITTEMGKAISESIAEVEKCAMLCGVYAKQGEQWLAEEVVEASGKKHRVIFEPLGVIFSVMPWNFPFWQALRFAVPALLAGNTSILKHASATTGCALEIEQAFIEAGFPENTFRTVLADHATVADLIASPLIQGVLLTGSTEAGSRIAEQAGKHLKKVVLELGGSDPFIVLEDADIEVAAKGAVTGRTLNCGQSCIAAKRFIVVKHVAEQFSAKFASLMSSIVIGDPMKEETKIGPLVNADAVNTMEAFVEDAVQKGGKILCGGKRKKGRGCFFEPTVITNTSPQMKIVREEVFGPIAPVIIVKGEKEAISIANHSEFGLGGSVWTKDLERGERVARQLEAGSVFVNSVVRSDPRMPFGGVKKSGIGRELSMYGLRE